MEVEVRYVGGKQRLVKHILPLMLEGQPTDIPWVEPFVGAGSVISQVPPTHPRLGADANPFLIDLFQALQTGWQPPLDLTEPQWRFYRQYKDDYSGARQLGLDFTADVAFAGFACSYAARWFEGYARDPKGGANFARNGARALERLSPLLSGVEFRCCSYEELELPPPPAIIYCDPPYDGSVKNYYRFGEFNVEEFWDWTLDRASGGYTVYVSSYECPLTRLGLAELLWSKERAVSLTKDTGKRWRHDCLFEVL